MKIKLTLLLIFCIVGSLTIAAAAPQPKPDVWTAITALQDKVADLNAQINSITKVKPSTCPEGEFVKGVNETGSLICAPCCAQCNIVDRWTQIDYQGSPVSGVYIEIYSDNRIELYRDGQLLYFGTWSWICHNTFQAIWAGRTVDTVTMSSDCNIQTYISNAGERSVFVRT